MFWIREPYSNIFSLAWYGYNNPAETRYKYAQEIKSHHVNYKQESVTVA